MKLVWLSDIHLEFLPLPLAQEFISRVGQEKPDAVLVTGDIGTARTLDIHLSLLAEGLPCKIYFVLGNHDFYKGDFQTVDALVKASCKRHDNLCELGHGEIIQLSPETSLIGHRGWADGRAGLGPQSTVRLNDHVLIADLTELDTEALFGRLNRLGDDSADYARQLAPQALAQAERLMVATHVPPFVAASLYENKPSDPGYAPHFVNLALGRALTELAQTYSAKHFTILCGHTHHAALYEPLPNLTVKVSGAIYRSPAIADIISL